MSVISNYEQDAIENINKSIHQGEWSDEGLVQLIELAGSYLNLMSIAEYAKRHNISYNGAKKFRKVKVILKHKFIIDNE